MRATTLPMVAVTSLVAFNAIPPTRGVALGFGAGLLLAHLAGELVGVALLGQVQVAEHLVACPDRYPEEAAHRR